MAQLGNGLGAIAGGAADGAGQDNTGGRFSPLLTSVGNSNNSGSSNKNTYSNLATVRQSKPNDILNPPKGTGDGDMYLSKSQINTIKNGINEAVNNGDVEQLRKYEDLIVRQHWFSIQQNNTKNPIIQNTPNSEGIVEAIANNKRYIEYARIQAIQNYEAKTGLPYIPSGAADVELTPEEIEKRYSVDSIQKQVGDINSLDPEDHKYYMVMRDAMEKESTEKDKKFNYELPNAISQNPDGTYDLGGYKLSAEQKNAVVADWTKKTGAVQLPDGKYVNKKAISKDDEGNAVLKNADGTKSIVSGDYDNLASMFDVGAYQEDPTQDMPANSLIYLGEDKDTRSLFGEKIPGDNITTQQWSNAWDTMSDEQRSTWSSKLAALGLGGSTPLEEKKSWEQYGSLLAESYNNGEGNKIDPSTAYTNYSKQPGVGVMDAEATEKAAIAQATQGLLEYGMANGITFDQASLGNQVERLVNGKASIDQIKQEYRDTTLANRYPAWADKIKSGVDVSTIAGDYIDIMSKTLEVSPQQIDVNDATIQKALTAVDPNTGKPTFVPLWQFANNLKSDERYWTTNQANNSMAQLGASIAKSFGNV